jgi:hypothetical protein
VAREHKYDVVIDPATGNAINGATVFVENVNDLGVVGAPASIFLSESGSAKSNPFTTGADGYWEFWASTGARYRITITAPSFTRFLWWSNNYWPPAVGKITTAHITDGTIVGADLAVDSVTSRELAPDSVDAVAIAPQAVGNTELAFNSVSTDEIIDGQVFGIDVAPNSQGADILTPSLARRLAANQTGTSRRIRSRTDPEITAAVSGPTHVGPTGSVIVNSVDDLIWINFLTESKCSANPNNLTITLNQAVGGTYASNPIIFTLTPGTTYENWSNVGSDFQKTRESAFMQIRAETLLASIVPAPTYPAQVDFDTSYALDTGNATAYWRKRVLYVLVQEVL